jgi:hypothetical protein
MRRFLVLLTAASALCAGGALALAACGSSAEPEVSFPDGGAAPRLDGGVVDPPEGGLSDAAPPGPEPSCARYCSLIAENCEGEHAQYASEEQCLATCAHLPVGERGDRATNSLACRQYYAGTPAQTTAASYCLAAGPFGGSVCGDRCTAFCQIALGACPPDGGPAPYASYPDCATACAGFVYRDVQDEGGGEGPFGPEEGDTLNCRMFHLREALADRARCADVAADSDACR